MGLPKSAREAERPDTGRADVPVRAHLGFVLRIARGFRGCGLPVEDLVGEGCVGLMVASRRFDPSRGVHFTTYAAYWVRRSILRALDRQVRVVRVPREARRNGVFTREVWIDAEGLTLDAVSSRQAAATPGASPLDDLMRDESRDRLCRSMSSLSARERAVLELRYGLRDGRERTLRQIGESVGLSREGARLVAKRALAHLRADLGASSTGADGFDPEGPNGGATARSSPPPRPSLGTVV